MKAGHKSMSDNAVPGKDVRRTGGCRGGETAGNTTSEAASKANSRESAVRETSAAKAPMASAASEGQSVCWN